LAVTVYCDTSALLKLYVLEAESRTVARYIRDSRARIRVTSLHELEMSSALSQRVFRGELKPGQCDKALADFEADIAARALRRFSPPWAAVFDEGARLCRQHGARTGTRSIDALHVAVARTCAADVLVTFDARQRALAKITKLKTWPA